MPSKKKQNQTQKPELQIPEQIPEQDMTQESLPPIPPVSLISLLSMLPHGEGLPPELALKMNSNLELGNQPYKPGSTQTLAERVRQESTPLILNAEYVQQILCNLSNKSPEAYPVYSRWYPRDIYKDISRILLADDQIRSVLTSIAILVLGTDALNERWTCSFVVALSYSLYLFLLVGMVPIPIGFIPQIINALELQGTKE